MSDPKKRIRWTIEERRTLAQRLAEVLRAEPRLSKLQAMDRAQTALPPERRRHLAAWSTVREFIEPYMPALGAEVADDAVAETDAGTAGDEVEAHGADTLPLPISFTSSNTRVCAVCTLAPCVPTVIQLDPCGCSPTAAVNETLAMPGRLRFAAAAT